MKERLTGAIILVALIVLVVPELLTGPLRSKPAGIASRAAGAAALPAAGAPSSTAPSSKAPPAVRSYTLALAPFAPARGIGKRTVGKGVPKPLQEGAPPPPSMAARSPLRGSLSNAPPRAAPAAVSAPKPKPRSPGGLHDREHALAAKASPPRAARTPAAHGPQASARWVVQLASFSRHANALQLARRLRRGHFPVAVAPLRVRGRLWWRVWAGPVRDRAAAQRLARRLRPIGVRGEVLRE